MDARQVGLVEPLGKIMAQIVSGGGAASVNIDVITQQLVDLGKKFPFQVGRQQRAGRGLERGKKEPLSSAP